MHHPARKLKVNPVVNKVKKIKLQKKKTMIKKSIMIMVIIDYLSFSLKSCLEMKDESDAAISDKKTTVGRKGRTAGATKKRSENADSATDDLNLSEGEDSADDKENTTTKKGPTKRSAPSSDKKTGATTGKKRSAEDEPFDDRTNADDSAEAENNSEDGSLIHIDY